MNNLQRSRQREEQILLSLDKHGFMTRSQLQRLHALGTPRNASRVLKNMSECLNTFREHENVYYLNKRGRERIGSATIRTRSLQIHHILMRNELYLFFNRPSYWQTEIPVAVGDLKLIPDVLFAKDKYYFAEIDHTQKMTVNQKKIEKYRQLKKTGAFQERYKHFPKLIWVTTTEHRKKQLQNACKDLEHDVYTLEDFR
jgi:Replication-relaxation